MSTSAVNMRTAVKTESGWQYCEHYAAVGHKQRRLLVALSRQLNQGRLARGALTRAAESAGFHREAGWTQLRRLRQKFGAYNNIQLAHIARQLSRTRGRGRSSNRASTFVTVGKPLNPSSPHPEALQPGTAPSRAL